LKEIKDYIQDIQVDIYTINEEVDFHQFKDGKPTLTSNTLQKSYKLTPNEIQQDFMFLQK
jgi:hypothetical protein